jgi:sugar phosphate isomerase/epimerase
VRFFYNTNGFAFHRLEDAVSILADLGYDGVAWTPDVHHLDPGRVGPAMVRAFRDLLRRRNLSVVVETGARFVLDPKRKHRPSLLDPPAEARVRLAFLERCVDLAKELGAPLVSVWSGNGPPGLAPGAAMERLADGLRRLCDHAANVGVRIGFEPEPGMAVETVEGWTRVRDAVGHPALGLTLDVGHCLATREGDPADLIRQNVQDLLVLQLDDHRRGTHEHLAFGEGDVDFAAVASAVSEAGFAGPLEVELSRHSSTAPDTAERSLAFLRRTFGPRGGSGGRG